MILRRSRRLHTPGLAIANHTEFAARYLPLARATSLESWSDLSGVSYRRAGLFSHTEVWTLGGVTLALKAIDALLVELGSAPA